MNIVKVELDNKDGKIKSGMMAEVSFTMAASDDTILLPRNAVIEKAVSYTHLETEGCPNGIRRGGFAHSRKTVRFKVYRRNASVYSSVQTS